MSKTKIYYEQCNPRMYSRTTINRYGFFNFMFDLFMICITFGLWLIWIFIREMRNN